MVSQDLTLVGPPWDKPEIAPLPVLHLNNRLCIKTALTPLALFYKHLDFY